MTTKTAEQKNEIIENNETLISESFKITNESLLEKFNSKDFSKDLDKLVSDTVSQNSQKSNIWNLEELKKTYPNVTKGQQLRTKGKNLFYKICKPIEDLHKESKKVNSESLFQLHTLQLKYFTDRSAFCKRTSKDVELQKEGETFIYVANLLNQFRIANNL